MNRRISLTLLAVALGATTLVSPSFAKDALETAEKAQNEADKAAVKDAKATNERIRTSNAVDEGHAGSAAKHAKDAAKVQRSANRKTDKAVELENKAAEKAVKESE